MDLSETYQMCMFLIAIFTMSLQLFVIYLIIYVSPKNMRNYRRYLITTTICEFCFVFNLGIVFMPEVGEFAPGSGFHPRGLAATMGENAINLSALSVYFFGVLMIYMQDLCLCYRLCAVFPNREFCKRFSATSCTVGLAFFGLFVAVTMSAGLYHAIAPPSDHKAILDAWTMAAVGQTIELDLVTPRLLIYNNKPYVKQFYTVVAACLLISEWLYFGGVFLILKTLSRYSAKFSRRSLKLHKQLAVLLAIQVLAPALLFAAPILHLYVQMDRKPMNTRLRSQIGLLVFSSHPFVMSFLLVVLVTPYRQFVLKKLLYILYPSKVCTNLTVVSASSTGVQSLTSVQREL